MMDSKIIVSSHIYSKYHSFDLSITKFLRKYKKLRTDRKMSSSIFDKVLLNVSQGTYCFKNTKFLFTENIAVKKTA